MNTSLHDLINVIESVKFDANMSVFSGFNSFHRAVGGDQTIQGLSQLLIDFPTASEQLSERLVSLLERDVQPEYEHPYDIAIASYLFALSASSNNVMTIEAAKKILATSNLIWAKRLAEIVLANQTASIESEVKVMEASKYSFAGSNNLVVISSSQVIISSNLSESSTRLTKTTSPYRSNPRSKPIRLIMSA